MVGAPYEDNFAGAVYVFHGTSKGPSKIYSQVTWISPYFSISNHWISSVVWHFTRNSSWEFEKSDFCYIHINNLSGYWSYNLELPCACSRMWDMQWSWELSLSIFWDVWERICMPLITISLIFRKSQLQKWIRNCEHSDALWPEEWTWTRMATTVGISISNFFRA